jgi:predicted MFS family arabinose efflux permease
MFHVQSSDTDAEPVSSESRSARGTVGLVLLFSTMYFVQGIAEPTEGLISQPVRSLLKSWGRSAAEIAAFGAILSLPWSFKPLYGLLSDFVPLAGTRRRSYLLLTTAITFLGLGYLYFAEPPRGNTGVLLTLLLLPTLGVAFSDVVIDALMVEKGQPLGLTGLLQSAQWTAMYAGTIVAGLLGGYLSQHNRQEAAFLICAATTFVTLILTWFCVPERPRPRPQSGLDEAMAGLRAAIKSPAVLAAALFVSLWSFNPFNTSVLYVYATEELGLSEQFYGTTVSLLAVGAIIASLAYGTYCRRLSFTTLIHLSIVSGILSTLAYWGMYDRMSAAVVNVVVGFTYMTGNLVQFDMVARVCPLNAAGTTFALLMGLTNLSMSLSAALGGWFYDNWSSHWGPTTAFNLLVLVGALTNAACWLVIPLLKNKF